MTKQKEWMVHVWSGAWNDDANPSIEKDYGVKAGYHYFNTEEEKNKLRGVISATLLFSKEVKMKVTKIICDVCGKEVKYINKYTFPMNISPNCLKDSFTLFKTLDVCLMCEKKIANCLQESFGMTFYE